MYHEKSTGYLGAWSVNNGAFTFATDPNFAGAGDCTLDEVALFDRVLTEAEILLLAQRAQPPVANGDSASVPESATTAIDVTANDAFVGAKANLTIEITAQPGGGDSVAVNANRDIAYTAGAVTGDQVRSFSYLITDPNGASNVVAATVTVLDSGGPPPAQANCFVISGAGMVEVNSAAAPEAAVNAAPPAGGIDAGCGGTDRRHS